MKRGFRRVQVVGIGSGIGVDEIGWRIVERLAGVDLNALAPAVAWHLDGCAVPAQLPALVRGADVVVLIDALPGTPGTVQRIDWRELADGRALCSSHGIDLREALELMASLATGVPDIRIYGVGVGDVTGAPAQPSAPDELVAEALPVLLQKLAADFG